MARTNTKHRILKLLIAGLTYKEIAATLRISHHTVDRYLRQMRREAGARTNPALVFRMRHDLAAPDRRDPS